MDVEAALGRTHCPAHGCTEKATINDKKSWTTP